MLAPGPGRPPQVRTARVRRQVPPGLRPEPEPELEWEPAQELRPELRREPGLQRQQEPVRDGQPPGTAPVGTEREPAPGRTELPGRKTERATGPREAASGDCC